MKLLASSAFLALTPALALAGWSIDESHSHAAFSVSHMVVSDVSGEFKGITGTVHLNDTDLSKSKVDVTIDTSTVDTRDAKRDGHLKAADFLDISKHPTMRFRSKSIRKSGKGWKVKGNLTIRGVTKPVTLDATVSKSVKSPWGSTIRAVKASTTIDRQDFGISWNKTLDQGGLLVGNEVAISINLELIQS